MVVAAAAAVSGPRPAGGAPTGWRTRVEQIFTNEARPDIRSDGSSADVEIA